MATKTYRWNPQDYRLHASAQYQWAMELINKLDLRGDEAVLDIGCGEGQVTAAMASTQADGMKKSFVISCSVCNTGMIKN